MSNYLARIESNMIEEAREEVERLDESGKEQREDDEVEEGRDECGEGKLKERSSGIGEWTKLERKKRLSMKAIMEKKQLVTMEEKSMVEGVNSSQVTAKDKDEKD